MAASYPALGKRERNKQQKLDRIIDAASELFADRGIEAVTIDEIAHRARIGKGTVFLYVKTKGELVLLVQNAHYRAALERARVAASAQRDPSTAIAVVIREIVTCNRIRIDNGRNYLREILFGDAGVPQRDEALAIVDEADDLIAALLDPDATLPASEALDRARTVSQTMYQTLSLTENQDRTDDSLVDEIVRRTRPLLL